MQNSYHDPFILKSRRNKRKDISTSTVHYLSIGNRSAILDLKLLLLGHGLGRDNLSKTLQSRCLKPFGNKVSSLTSPRLESTHKMVYKFPKL